MAFPVLYDVVVTTIHLAVTFTPKPNYGKGDDTVNYITEHVDYYMDHKYDPSKVGEEYKDVEINAWTIWSMI